MSRSCISPAAIWTARSRRCSGPTPSHRTRRRGAGSRIWIGAAGRLRLPIEYAAIEAADAITRGQLAALLGLQFESVLAGQAGDRAAIITDAATIGSYRWMIDVAQAGIMQADVNYRFQPERVVNRAELAQIMVRLLRAAGVRSGIDGRAAAILRSGSRTPRLSGGV